MKNILLSLLLLASPLFVAKHDMGAMDGDLARKVRDYLVIVNRDSNDVNFYELSTGKHNRV